MRVIDKSKGFLPKLKKDIEKFGDVPDHHPYYFLYEYFPKDYGIFYFDFKEKGGILAHNKNNIWKVTAEPIAKNKDRIILIEKFLKYIGKGKKVMFEDCRENLKKEIFELSKKMKLRPIKPHFVSYWPMYELSDFDKKLKGKRWKKLRKAKNYFIKRNKVRITDVCNVKKELLKKIIYDWKDKRKDIDVINSKQYLRFIENGFPGCKEAKAVLVNNIPAAFFCGWKVPNANCFYPSMSIHNYQYKEMSVFLAWNIFSRAKKQGYQYLDFGGSDQDLLIFKRKFHPFKIYKAYSFSIVPLK